MAFPLISVAMGAFSLVKSLVGGGGFLDTVNNVIDAVAKKEMTATEAKASVAKSWADAWSAAEQQYAKSAADVFAKAQETIQASFKVEGWFTKNAWAFVVVSQTLVLLWYQAGLPMVVYVFDIPLTGPGSIPRTGDQLLGWAYALVGGALGIGVIKGNLSGIAGKLIGKH